MDELESKLLEAARARFELAEDAEREGRILAEEDFDFIAGEQWPNEIKNQRQRQNRPCLTINRLPTFIRQITGDARQNPIAIKVHPAGGSADEEMARIYSGLVRNIEQQSNAMASYSWALKNSLTGSMGHWRVTTEYADDDTFEQDIRIRRIHSPFAVYWDPDSKEYDRSDAKWCFVSEWLTKKAFEEKYPDKTPSDWKQEYKGSASLMGWSTAERVRIAEYWVKEPVDKTLALLENGEVVDISGIEEYASAIPIVSTRQVKSHKVVCYKLSGHAILEGPMDFPSRYIPIVSVFGPEEWIGERGRHVSLIRYAKDSQRLYNFSRTSNAEKIALAPRAPFVGTAKQFAGHEREWDLANVENRSRLTYTPDPGAPPPQRQSPADVNAAEIEQSERAVDDMKATIGMFDASLGSRSNETSGRAIIARQREGDNASYDWIDNLSWSVQYTGRILVDMIPRVYDTARVIRVLEEDDSYEMVPINNVIDGHTFNDLSIGKYDVVVSVGPSYATKRLESANSMMQFIQAFPLAGQVAGDLIAKSMDWPGADQIAERLKKALPPGMSEQEDISPEEQQMLAQKQQAEAAKQAEIEKIMKVEKLADIEYKHAQTEKLKADTEKAAAETAVTLLEVSQ